MKFKPKLLKIVVSLILSFVGSFIYINSKLKETHNWEIGTGNMTGVHAGMFFWSIENILIFIGIFVITYLIWSLIQKKE